jgi:four helix bundle protein
VGSYLIDIFVSQRDGCMDGWKKTTNLAEVRYKISNRFPKEEIFVVTRQIPLAAVSVASNLFEGAARKREREFIQFISIPKGSLFKVETRYPLGMRLNFIQ